MKKILRWLWLFHKRLYKKILFLVILGSVPLLVFLLQLISRQESGLIHITVCVPNQKDPVAVEIRDELTNSESLILFSKCDSEEKARQMVITGEADAAWILAPDFKKQLLDFSKVDSARKPIAAVIEREQTIPLRLSHEKLASVLFSHCSRPLYINFVRTQLSQLDSVSDRELLSDYDLVDADEDFFSFETINNSSYMQAKSTSYLLSPIRGMLSILVLICGLAAAVFFMEDEEKGTFSWVPQSKKVWAEFACEMIPVMNMCVVLLLSLSVSGLSLPWKRELPALPIFAVGSCLFCMLLREITRTKKVLCSLIPLLIIVMIAVCPVFFDFRFLRPIQLLFPPTYYLRAIYDAKYLLYMAIYSLCIFVLYFGIFRRSL